MKSSDAFSNCHPLVNLLYFAAVIGFATALMQPVCIIISLFCAGMLNLRQQGGSAAKFMLKFALPLFLTAAVINPAFNHRGTKILCYLLSGNPLTLESIIYGFAAAATITSVLLWFSSFSAVMTSDKLIYLFGRVIPALSLLIAMTLRFVPRFARQLDSVKEAQLAFDSDTREGGIIKQLRAAFACFSVLVSWSLENSVETAAAMKSRGYGLKGRSSYANYFFTARDIYFLIYIIFCAAALISGSLFGGLYWRYYPNIGGDLFSPRAVLLEIIYFLLCAAPTALDLREDLKWKRLRSKI